MRPLQIFGAGQTAEAIIDMVREENLYEVVNVCVDDGFDIPGKSHGPPIISLSVADKAVPIFVAIGFNDLNHSRASVYKRLKNAGFTFVSLISNRAAVSKTSEIGENCLVMEFNNVQASTRLGDNTFLWSGNHIGHHTTIGSNCYISSHCVVSGAVSIGDYSFVGVNTSIGDNLSIGQGCIVGQGSIINSDIQDYSIVKSPASDIYVKNEKTNRRVLRR